MKGKSKSHKVLQLEGHTDTVTHLITCPNGEVTRNFPNFGWQLRLVGWLYGVGFMGFVIYFSYYISE